MVVYLAGTTAVQMVQRKVVLRVVSWVVWKAAPMVVWTAEKWVASRVGYWAV